MLDLRLGGIDVDGVSLQFNKAHSRNALQEAQTEEQRLQTVLEKIRTGLITPDEGAQDLGQESWFNEELLFADQTPPATATGNQDNQLQKTMRRVTLRFDKESQRYRYQPERIEIWSGTERDDQRVVPFIKQKAQGA